MKDVSSTLSFSEPDRKMSREPSALILFIDVKIFDEIFLLSLVIAVIFLGDNQINGLLDKLRSYRTEHLNRKPDIHNIFHCVDSPFRSKLIKCRYISDN